MRPVLRYKAWTKVLALELSEAASASKPGRGTVCAPTTVQLGFTVMAEDTKIFLEHTCTAGLQKEEVRPRYQGAGRDVGSNGTTPRIMTEGRRA